MSDQASEHVINVLKKALKTEQEELRRRLRVQDHYDVALREKQKAFDIAKSQVQSQQTMIEGLVFAISNLGGDPCSGTS